MNQPAPEVAPPLGPPPSRTGRDRNTHDGKTFKSIETPPAVLPLTPAHCVSLQAVNTTVLEKLNNVEQTTENIIFQ